MRGSEELTWPAGLTAALLVLVLPAASPALAQPYAIPWHTVEGGGATFGTGGTYSLGGTIGQPDASGPLTGGAYALAGGFWSGALINQPPVLAAIGDRTVAERAILTFATTATDPEGDPLTYSATGLPPGATFSAASRTFSWTPALDQAGTYPGVTFTVSDPNGGLDSEAITITVTNTNQPPLLAAIGNQTIGEASPLTFTVSAIDPDGDPLTYGASSLPAGASFNPGTRTFTWTPTYAQSGTYPGVTFTVSDGHGGLDSEVITIGWWWTRHRQL